MLQRCGGGKVRPALTTNANLLRHCEPPVGIAKTWRGDQICNKRGFGEFLLNLWKIEGKSTCNAARRSLSFERRASPGCDDAGAALVAGGWRRRVIRWRRRLILGIAEDDVQRRRCLALLAEQSADNATPAKRPARQTA